MPNRKEYRVVVDECGLERWYNQNGELSRENGPAITWPYGEITYYLDGKVHRLDGPAAISPDGYRAYYLHGQLHREDGPAVIHSNGITEYFINGKLHNENGPAFIDPNNGGYKQYWLNGEKVEEKDLPCNKKAKELTVKELGELLGFEVKIVKEKK